LYENDALQQHSRVASFQRSQSQFQLTPEFDPRDLALPVHTDAGPTGDVAFGLPDLRTEANSIQPSSISATNSTPRGKKPIAIFF